MKELIEFIAQRLVDHPEHVKVNLLEEEDSVCIELQVDQEDLGKVIGKQGRTVRAMRTILAASQHCEGKRARLEIIE